MSNLINRNDAIEAIDFEKVYMTAYLGYVNEGNPLKQYNKGLDDAIKAINKLPSAKPEQRSGTWCYYDSDNPKYNDIKCSVCRHDYTVDAEKFCDIGFTVNDLKYCPNCGAKMTRGEE